MKNLQLNDTRSGSQEYPLIETTPEDTYFYGAVYKVSCSASLFNGIGLPHSFGDTLEINGRSFGWSNPYYTSLDASAVSPENLKVVNPLHRKLF